MALNRGPFVLYFATVGIFLVTWGRQPCQNEVLVIYHRRHMKTVLSILLLLGFAAEANSRIGTYLSYEDLTKKSDLIIIARPTRVHETSEKVPSTKLGMELSDQDGKPAKVTVRGVETSFEVLVVFKGNRSTRKLVLHHYLRTVEIAMIMDGPTFVTFQPKEGKSYLMFLKREPDGRYAAVSGPDRPG